MFTIFDKIRENLFNVGAVSPTKRIKKRRSKRQAEKKARRRMVKASRRANRR